MNSLSDGPPFTSKHQANRFVTRGLATWVQRGKSIRFVREAADHRECSARSTAEKTQRGYDQASESGLARMDELANVPVMMPGVALGFGRRKGASRHTSVVTQGFTMRTAAMVRCAAEDKVTPGRFNPDRIEQPALDPLAAMELEKQFQAAQPHRTDERVAGPADAPTVPEARFSVRIDQSKPWSADNGMPVF